MALSIIADALDAVNTVTGLTKLANSDKKLLEVLLENSARIIVCGDLIKTQLEYVSSDLLGMEAKIQELSDQMTQQLDEMKEFITEDLFVTKCVSPVCAMMQHLQKVIGNPNEETFEMLREHCSPTPLRCALVLTFLLEQDSTNPLKKAMEEDEFRTKATFYKWKNTFNELFGKLLVLECMMNGMFFERNALGPKELCEEIVRFQDLMGKWEDEYRNDKDDYWSAVEKLRERVEKKFGFLDNKEKADFLKMALEKILTNHAFYIVVYDYCESWGQLSNTESPDQALQSTGYNNCCVFIYRSFEMNNGLRQTPEDLEKMANDVEACRYNTLPENLGECEFAKTLQETHFSKAGVVTLIRSRRNPEIRDVNSWKKWGPGWWITADDAAGKQWYLIAGYE